MPSETMRVLYIEAGSGSGGSSASLLRLLTHLAPQRVAPFVLINQHGTFTQELARRRIRIEELMIRDRHRAFIGRHWSDEPSRLWHNLFWLHGPLFRQIRTRLNDFHPQLIHINNSPRVALAVIAAARWHRIPVICHLRSARRLVSVERSVMRWIDRLIVTSAISRATCLQQGIPASKVVRIPNGLDVAAFRNGSDRTAARQRLGIADGQSVIGVVSRLIPGKGHDIFLHALRAVVAQRPEVRAVIVGDVCEGASGYPQSLQRLVANLKLSGHVRFVGWSQDVARLYPAFDLVAQTSLLPEGFSLICLEAMACQIPVVSTDVGATSEVVEDGVTGRVVPPSDAAAMTNAILELLNDPGRMQQMGAAGYQRALNHFDIRRTAEAVERVYRSVVEPACPATERWRDAGRELR